MTSKAQATKGEKIARLKFIKVKNICISKDTIKNMKRQTNQRQKIFFNYACDKRFVSKYVKKYYNSIVRR